MSIHFLGRTVQVSFIDFFPSMTSSSSQIPLPNHQEAGRLSPAQSSLLNLGLTEEALPTLAMLLRFDNQSLQWEPLCFPFLQSGSMGWWLIHVYGNTS